MPTSTDLTPQHVQVLTAIARGENPAIVPMMRKKLRALDLIVPAEPPRAIRTTPGRQRAPRPRRHEVTEAGRAALAQHGAGR